MKNLCCGDPKVCGHCVNASPTDTNYPARAKTLVQRVLLRDLGPNDPFPTFEVEVVKFEKILQHWRAVVVATGPGEGKYYEVTYNGDAMAASIDVYEKTKTFAIADATEVTTKDSWGYKNEVDRIICRNERCLAYKDVKLNDGRIHTRDWELLFEDGWVVRNGDEWFCPNHIPKRK